MQTFMCFVIASSVLISLSVLTISYFIASVHNPQIHFPWYLSRTLSMYAGVHSSIRPQQSHLTDSTSICAMSCVAVVAAAAAAAVACVSGAETTIGSLIIVADIANYPAEAEQTKTP